LWMDGLAVVSSLAVIGSLVWRIGDHRKSRERALSVGAITRAVPLPMGPGGIETGLIRSIPPRPRVGTGPTRTIERQGS
jgi:hypothetical protein